MVAQTDFSAAFDPAGDGFVTVDHRGHRLMIHGDLDGHTAPLVSAAAARLLPAIGRRLVLDFAAVEFCGAAGVNLAVELDREQRRRGGSAVVAHASRSVRRVFRSCGAGRLLVS
jgi:anti-anti-sigma factor